MRAVDWKDDVDAITKHFSRQTEDAFNAAIDQALKVVPHVVSVTEDPHKNRAYVVAMAIDSLTALTCGLICSRMGTSVEIQNIVLNDISEKLLEIARIKQNN